MLADSPRPTLAVAYIDNFIVMGLNRSTLVVDGGSENAPLAARRSLQTAMCCYTVNNVTDTVLRGASAVGRWTCDLQVAGSIPGRFFT